MSLKTPPDEPAIAPTFCPSCEAKDVPGAWILDEFVYGAGPQELTLSVRVPAYTCTACQFRFTDHVAESLRHEAVCRALGLLAPAEIVAIREQYGLSQESFSQLAGFGKASLGRWERGELLPNRSSDRLLRLLAYPENAERLKVLQLP